MKKIVGNSRVKISIKNLGEFEEEIKAHIHRAAQKKVDRWMKIYLDRQDIIPILRDIIVNEVRMEQYGGKQYGRLVPKTPYNVARGFVKIKSGKKLVKRSGREQKSNPNSKVDGETISELKKKLRLSVLASGDVSSNSFALKLSQSFDEAINWMAHSSEKPLFSTMTEAEQLKWIKNKGLNKVREQDSDGFRIATAEEVRSAIIAGQSQGYDSGAVFKKTSRWYYRSKDRETLHEYAQNIIKSKMFLEILASSIYDAVKGRQKGRKSTRRKGSK